MANAAMIAFIRATTQALTCVAGPFNLLCRQCLTSNSYTGGDCNEWEDSCTRMNSLGIQRAGQREAWASNSVNVSAGDRLVLSLLKQHLK